MANSSQSQNSSSPYLIAFGSDANCTLALCPIEASVQGYRPSLAANIAFVALFFIPMAVHLLQAILYRTWFFGAMMAVGCIGEMIGYAGRIMLWDDPFSFPGFIIEICCLTIAPVFFAAAIYVSQARITEHLGPEAQRFHPKLYYYLFVPCDIVSLVLQAVGGALSSTSTSTDDDYAVDITIGGLAFQICTLVAFIGMAADYVIRFARRRRSLPKADRLPITPRLKVFAVFFSAAILLILLRCCYRVAELWDGYGGDVFREEPLFIALESSVMVAAVLCLNIAHPGFAFQNRKSDGPEEYMMKGKDDYSVSESGIPLTDRRT